MNGVVRMQVVGSAGLGGESSSSADVVRVAVGVDHRFDREARSARQVQVRMEMAEGSITIAFPALATM